MADIAFCVAPGCFEVAVGTGYWQGRPGGRQNPAPPRPRDRCRAHLLELVAPELIAVDVVGDLPIVDYRTGKSMGKGHRVELDPVEVNIALLVAIGLVKVVATDAKPTKSRGDVTP